jgi:hypothetical protein
VNTGGCNDCHTTPNFAPPVIRPGASRSKSTSRRRRRLRAVHRRCDLTPAPQTGLPGGLTAQQFVRTMRTGYDVKQLHPETPPLLQVMPWPVYQDLTDRDLRAMYEYLRAIPHVTPGRRRQPRHSRAGRGGRSARAVLVSRPQTGQPSP